MTFLWAMYNLPHPVLSLIMLILSFILCGASLNELEVEMKRKGGGK
jgi:hypothetical protein